MAEEFDALTGDPNLSNKLEAYFNDVAEKGDLAQAFGLLPAQAVIQKTLEFRAFHPLVWSLHGIILDDPNTSDHHVMLCVAGVRGAVMHLCHDGTTRIVFKCTNSFLEAVGRAADEGGFVEDEHPTMAWVADEQDGLQDLISSLRNHVDYDDIGPALVPSLNLKNVEFLANLVEQDSVYVAEAVCREIEIRPAEHLMPVLERAGVHHHWMVRNASIRARAKINGLRNI